MPTKESCSCIDHVNAARDRLGELRAAERVAVDDFHRAIREAYYSPTCVHSRRPLAKAAGLSGGGLQNVLAGAGEIAS